MQILTEDKKGKATGTGVSVSKVGPVVSDKMNAARNID